MKTTKWMVNINILGIVLLLALPMMTVLANPEEEISTELVEFQPTTPGPETESTEQEESTEATEENLFFYTSKQLLGIGASILFTKLFEKDETKKIKKYKTALSQIAKLATELSKPHLVKRIPEQVRQLFAYIAQEALEIMTTKKTAKNAETLKVKIAQHIKKSIDELCVQKNLVPYCVMAEEFLKELLALIPLLLIEGQETTEKALEATEVMPTETYYDMLGIEQGASTADITKAYRRLALQYHPDKNRDNPEAAEMFKKIKNAYETLSDPDQRKIYDESL